MMTPVRFLALVVHGALLLGCPPGVAEAGTNQELPVSGPGLDVAPRPAIDPSELPPPAQWPVLRYESPLRIRVVTRQASVAAYQRMARRMRSSFEFFYESPAGDAIYHVNDKWIEPEKNPTAKELDDYLGKVCTEALAPRDGRPPADVIFSSRIDDPGLMASVQAGAVLVTCASVYPKENSPFASEWPAKPAKGGTWMNEGSRRLPGALALSGIPTERLSGWTWIPTAEATGGSAALSAKHCGAVYFRKVGKGAVIFAPTGPLSKNDSVVGSPGRTFDHDDIWLRLWDQLLYDSVRGAKAIPAWCDLEPGAKEAPPGQSYELPGRIINRSARAALEASVHVLSPQGKVVYSNVDKVDVPAEQEKLWPVRVPVADHWPSGLYPVYLTVGDPASKRQLHQALAYIPVVGRLKLVLASDKRGYRLGEEAELTLSASSAGAWSGSFCFGVYDFRGRLLATASRPAELAGAESRQFTFRYRMADHGVRVDTFWAVVAARKGEREWGRAEHKFYKYEPWSTRNEYQWSTWAGISCAPQSLVQKGMALMAHAGMNSLGYSGRSGLFLAAERWGWRSYNEGVGVNTFSPRIEYESDDEIEASLVTAEAKRHFDSPELTSASFVLASVGEEAGYKDGWGKTYYWDTPVAPEKACRAFQWFLKTRYGDLARMNATWKTAYSSWDEVKLTKEFSGPSPKLALDGWAHPKESPLGGGVTAVSLAPYSDTVQFYAWYYDRFIAIAKRILRGRINPVPRTMSSAPSSWIFDSRECEVRLAGPSGWNESQMHSTLDGREPGFGLIWGHFDWQVKTNDMFWGFLLARSGHNNYWVDVPLMFNADLTHTRASFAMRRWTRGLAGHERIILDSVPAPCDVGLLGANGVGNDHPLGNMATSLKVALMQGGFGMPVVSPGDLAKHKIIFAVGHQSVSKEEADRLDAYVDRGGVLVFTSRFANQDEFGALQSASPGCGLAEKWRLKTSPGARPSDPNGKQALPIGGMGEAFKGLALETYGTYREKVDQTGWTTLAAYEDGVPAVLSRTQGQGRLVYVNAVYASHWYIQFVTPTGPERQGFYRLVEWLCEQAGARRMLRLEGDLSQMLHVAVKGFTDPTGEIGYVVIRADGEAPWVAGSLKWLGPQTAGYDVLEGKPVGRDLPLNLRPGAGKLLAYVEKPLREIRVSASAPEITAGESLDLAVQILGTEGKPVRGSFPLEVRVRAASGVEIPGLSRSISLPSGGRIPLGTALNDAAGKWTVTVADAISGLSGQVSVAVTAPASVSGAPGFLTWGWPSEIEEPAEMGSADFVGRLRELALLYRADHSGDGWMTKQRLGYFYNYFPATRHSILRPLLDLDWMRFADAIRQAVTNGAEFILTGEDLGIHPGSGLSVYPHHDAGQFAALLAALEGATWCSATRDGDTLRASLGKGRIILCRESIDAAGHDNLSAARWHRRWLEELEAGDSARVPTPDLATLQRWWVGREAAVSRRTVSWFEGNLRERKMALDPGKSSGPVFFLLVPPTGELREVDVEVTGSGVEKAEFDVGCDNVWGRDWRKAAAEYARNAPYRDDSGWRVIPVRVRSKEKGEIQLKIGKMVVE